MTDIEQRIADETAAKVRIHNLKQARARLYDVRTSLKSIRVLVGTDPAFVSAIDGILGTSRIGNLMWKIEQAVRDGQKETK